MSDRETSFAKSVQLDSYQQSLLDRHERLRSQFSEASSNQQAQESGDKQGSSMIEKDSSTTKNRPPADMARDVDGEVHKKNMRNDDQAAKKSRQQALLNRQERLKQNEDANKSSNSNKSGYSNDM